jgi:pyruvate/2-oxoglutarate dehydrogenase complex dihydrolipoamide acyltransferase (E2) component
LREPAPAPGPNSAALTKPSLTYDHCCLTREEAARFMAVIIRDLQKGN